jgi:fatty acid-binding protein DegV
VGKTRTQQKAFTRLIELVIERAGGRPVFAAIQHNDAAESAAHLEDMLREVLAEGSSIMTMPMETTLAVHTGAGAIGVSAVFMSRPEDPSPVG